MKFLVITIAISMGLGWISAVIGSDSVVTNHANALLALFIKNPSEDLLRQTYQACQDIPEDQTSLSWNEIRNAKLKLLLQLVLAIDASKDPRFNLEKITPNTSSGQGTKAPKVALPPDAFVEGVELGQDPEQIKDPKTKKQYLEWIRKRNLEIQYSSFQIALIRLEKDCLNYANEFVWATYKPSEKTIWQEIVKATVKDDKKSQSIIDTLSKY